MGLFVKDKEIIDISPAHVAKVMQVKKTLDKNAEKISKFHNSLLQIGEHSE